jgi:hypothetical protein
MRRRDRRERAAQVLRRDVTGTRLLGRVDDAPVRLRRCGGRPVRGIAQTEVAGLARRLQELTPAGATASGSD